MPIATIVIPAWNAEGFVAEAVHSALCQTEPDIEIIAVDDCSTDGTAALLEAMARDDPRMRVLRRRINGGPGATCNLGYAQARGKWVTVLDADDLYLPTRIERLVALAEAAGADMIADNLLQQDFDTGTGLGLHFPPEDMRCAAPLTLAEMLRRDMPDLRSPARLGFVQPMIRRAFLERHGLGFTPQIHVGEDFLHYFECVAHGARFVLTEEAHYVYRIRAGSLTYRPSAIFHAAAANQHLRRIARRQRAGAEVQAMLRQRQERLDLHALARAAADGDLLQALRYLRPGAPAGMLRQGRILAGALRRRLAQRRAVLTDL